MTTGLDGKRHLSCNPGSNMSGIHKKVPLNRSLIAGVARAKGHNRCVLRTAAPRDWLRKGSTL